MTSKTDSRWLPSFEKARGRVLIDKLMAGGGGGEGVSSPGETNASTEEGGIQCDTSERMSLAL